MKIAPAQMRMTGNVQENLWGNGVVFIAEIDEIGALPESEMEEVAFFYQLPPNLTYPEITPVLLQKAKEAGLL